MDFPLHLNVPVRLVYPSLAAPADLNAGKEKTMTRNRVLTVILVLVLITGLGVLVYPFVSNMLHDRKQDEIITEYDEKMENLDQEEWDAMLAEAREYNESLLGNVVLTDPFDPAAMEKQNEEYDSLLNIDGNGVMAYLEIPRIDLYEAVYHGTSDEVLARGIGHLMNTSLPVGGEGTHAVLSGHTGLPEAELFTNLEQVKEGDIFYIHVLGETLAYEVDQIKVVEPSDTSDLLIEQGKDYVTLVTCTPYGINSHRLLVRGHRVPYTEELRDASDAQAAEGVDGESWKTVYGRALLEGVLIAAVILGVLIFFVKWKRRKNAQDSGRKRKRRRRR